MGLENRQKREATFKSHHDAGIRSERGVNPRQVVKKQSWVEGHFPINIPNLTVLLNPGKNYQLILENNS